MHGWLALTVRNNPDFALSIICFMENGWEVRMNICIYELSLTFAV